MPGRRRSWLGILGVLGLAVVAGLAVGGSRKFGRRPAARPDAPTFHAGTPLEVLVPALRESDARALSALSKRLTANPDAQPSAIREVEAKAWLDTVAALRSGFLKFGGYGRTSALIVATKILDRFAIEEAPSSWIDVLQPVQDLLSSGMVDVDPDVRATAVAEVGRLWGWTPGRTPEPLQEDKLGDWKSGLHRSVLRCLADRAEKVRVVAVACLGNLPIDHAAAPAIPYLEDMTSSDVRRQVLISFARRRALLSEDAILKRTYDPQVSVSELAELVLKTRGLTQEQIGLGRLIFHPKPELRASVIPLLKKRTDIDPVVWLIQLSRDSEPSVRVSAVEALSSRLSPEVRRRLAEMADNDQSPPVRQAASKVVPPTSKTTAALPPLPGSMSLNPKAN